MDPLVSFACDLASTFSVSGHEEAAVRRVGRELTDLGFDTVRIDDVGNVMGVLGGSDGPRLLIDGHIDSIPLHSENDWSVDPFGGEIIDGRLYGLGICDQKASIAAAGHGVAAEAHRAGLAGSVAVVASVGEEEMEGCALTSAVEWFGPDYVVTSEPNDTRLGIGQRGRAKAYARVTGHACHAGHAAVGINAAEALAALIVEARALDHPTHPALGRRDLTCIDVTSWPYPSVSVVPGRAEARFDCRFVPGETPGSILDLLRGCAERAWTGWRERPRLDVGLVDASFTTWTGAKLSAPEFAAAWWTDEDSPLVRGATAAMVDAGLDPTPTHYSFCTNGSLTAGQLGLPTIGFGVGVESMAHQVDEHVTLDSLRAGARVRRAHPAPVRDRGMTIRSSVRRVIPLTLGWQHLPKSVSVRGADPSIRLREPVPGVLLDVDGGWILLDAGFNAPFLLDPPLLARYAQPGQHDELPAGGGDPMETAFGAVGVDLADVVAVGLSHLHYDHAGGLRWFAGRVPVHCQRRELDHALDDKVAAASSAFHRVDYDDPRIDWRLVDGDVEIAPGVTAVPTYGHTPGHQSFVVDLADGAGFVFAFDAADLQENIDDELSPGYVVDDDTEPAIEAIRRLKAIAAERGYRVIPGHDPDVWPAFTAELAGRERPGGETARGGSDGAGPG